MNTWEEWCEEFPEFCTENSSDGDSGESNSSEESGADETETSGDDFPDEWCEQFPEFCDDIDDCEQFPDLCDSDGNQNGSGGPGCIEEWSGDAWCDPSNNNENCGWDGGDCCPSTCIDSQWLCGNFEFDCEDPGACENTGECDESIAED